MLVDLRSLFGLTCIDEPLPAGTERDCSNALMETAVLRAAMEKAQAPELVQDPSLQPEQVPAPEPTNETVLRPKM